MSGFSWMILSILGERGNKQMRVLLREATNKDLKLILKWRSIKQVYEGLYTQSREQRPLTLQEHLDWWESHKHWRRYIIVADNKDVGWLYISLLDYWSPEIGLGIGEVSLWDKGIGKQALIWALSWLGNRGYKYTHTTILDNNERSIRLFESLGYVKGPGSRPNESWYFKELK